MLGASTQAYIHREPTCRVACSSATCPDPESIRSQKSLRFLGKLTHDPNLWHLNRHSVSRAMAAGLFAAFIPMPMQMLLAAGLAVWIRAICQNLRRIGLADQSDHDAPVFYCTYKLGAWLMQVPPRTPPDHPHLGMDQPGAVQPLAALPARFGGVRHHQPPSSATR
ncbi:DUF2062 domain-containing protein [Pseudomonas aeruginosa]|nr:DUF2062 domain-containing protein [Pseudomonas aeruginosa]